MGGWGNDNYYYRNKTNVIVNAIAGKGAEK